MRKALAPILLVLLSAFVVIACQPVMPVDQLPAMGTPMGQEGATGVVTGTATPAAPISPTTTLTATEPMTATPAVTGTQGAIPEAVFVAVEYQFDGPTSIPGGLVRIVLDNQGEIYHDFFLVKLDEGRTIEDVITEIEQNPDAPPPDWVDLYGGTEAEAGESNSYLVDLTPGNYAYLSFGEAEDGPPDVAQGMLGALTVTESTAESSAALPPQVDQEVEMLDFAFDTTDTWEAGEQTVHVTNVGEELHHLIIFRLQEGMTFADLMPFLEKEESESEPPIDYYGGMYDLSPGVDAYFTQEFDPGAYIFICFLPSEENGGAPHFTLGMVREVNVE